MPEYADSDDEDMDLPGAVPSNRKGAVFEVAISRPPGDGKQNDERDDLDDEEPMDPKAEWPN